MASDTSSRVFRRDDDYMGTCVDTYTGREYSCNLFWYSRTGTIIKWSLFFAFIILMSLYFFGGRQWARKRIRAGKKPVFGTNWLLSRRERGIPDRNMGYTTVWPGQANGGGYYQTYRPNHQGGYPMEGMYAPPPPVYDGHRPPQYSQEGGPAAEQGGAKISPNQSSGVGPAAPPAGEYMPPAGPPPGR